MIADLLLVAGVTSIRTTSFTTSERKVEFLLRDLKYVTTSIKVGSFGLFSKCDFKRNLSFLKVCIKITLIEILDRG